MEATSVRLERYFEFIGNPRESFFQGSFLTGQDLQQEQDYLNLKQVISKYIGETERNLSSLFSRAGETDVNLFFDEAESLFGKRTDVHDAHERFDDFVVLDEPTNRWSGQLVLNGVDDLPPGLYADVAGTFERVAAVPELASGVLLVTAVGGFLAWRQCQRLKRSSELRPCRGVPRGT